MRFVLLLVNLNNIGYTMFRRVNWSNADGGIMTVTKGAFKCTLLQKLTSVIQDKSLMLVAYRRLKGKNLLNEKLTYILYLMKYLDTDTTLTKHTHD